MKSESSSSNLYYSLGSNCACARYLKKFNLRLTASPFDWLGGVVDFKTRFDHLLNDFETFLLLENLQPLKDQAISAEYENFVDTKTGYYFLHDFPKGTNVNEYYDEVKNKYDRRIERFYSNIKNLDYVTLVWFSHLFRTSDSEILSCTEKFSEKMQKNIDYIVIEHDASFNHNEIKEVVLNDHVTKYSTYTRKHLDSQTHLFGNESSCDKIFSKLKLM